MNLAVAAWLFFRLARWIAWATLLGFSFYFVQDRAPHLNSFGHLSYSTEAIMFGSGLAAVLAGFIELMMREKAGLVRPRFGQLMPPTDPALTNRR